jgi:hypothetical protein
MVRGNETIPLSEHMPILPGTSGRILNITPKENNLLACDLENKASSQHKNPELSSSK